MSTSDLYIATYSSGDAHPHHSLIQAVGQHHAVDAVYAARHADLAPVLVAMVYDESDEDGTCYGYKLHNQITGELLAEDWFYLAVEDAVAGARMVVEDALMSCAS